MMTVYFDYDGVFGDTMTPAIQEMKELGLYETEEGRTKYFKELDWGKFLIKAGFIKNAIETINILTEKGYKVAFLTHVNSFMEHIEKINFIKNIKTINNVKNIDVIAVPRKYDKAFTINAKGNVLIDDRPENIEEWDANGGVGILFTDKDNSAYRTAKDLLCTIDIISKARRQFINEETASRIDIIASVGELIRTYRAVFHTFLIYEKLLQDGDIHESDCEAVESHQLKSRIEHLYSIASGTNPYILNIINEDIQEFISLALQIEGETKKEKYRRVRAEVSNYYDDDEATCVQNRYELERGISHIMDSQPVYSKVYNNMKWTEYWGSKGYAFV